MSEKLTILQQIITDIKNHKCSLRSGCLQAVPGEGNPDSDLMFIGEAPGRTEDAQGRPFVGSAGQILNNLLATIGRQRQDIYITNVVKCRPPNNRDPLPAEVAEHSNFLQRELDLIKPKLIVLLGRHALHWFLPQEQISKCHGQAKRQGQYVYFPVYHPAAVLHNPNLLNDLKNDFIKISAVLAKINQPSVQDITTNESQQSVEQITIF